MRVTHVIASSRGGGAVHVQALARAQVAAGHEVEVAMPEEGETSPDAIRAGGVATLDPGPAGPRWVSALGRHLRCRRPDLVHVHGARAALWTRLAVARLGPRPVVLYAFHGLTAPFLSGPARLARRLGEVALAPFTTGYLCVCEAERVEALRFGLPAGRLHVIHNGVDLSRFARAADREEDGPGARLRAQLRRELGLPEESFVAITAGRLDRPRDPGLILRALFHLEPRHARLRLLVLGEGPLRAEAEALAVRLGLEERVRFLGFRKDLPALLGAADALVHVTSAWEGFPYAVLEAMAAGLPVVASRAGGIPEAVAQGETGLLVPVGDEAALSEALGRLADDPQSARRMGAAGLALVQSRFDEARMCEAYEALYGRLVFGSRLSSPRTP